MKNIYKNLEVVNSNNYWNNHDNYKMYRGPPAIYGGEDVIIADKNAQDAQERLPDDLESSSVSSKITGRLED